MPRICRSAAHFLIALLFILPGCARSPSGGAVVPASRNRLSIDMTIAGVLNPAYYYDFAFDDDDDSSDGPVAIVGSTTLVNGVAGGTFTVLVQLHGGQFIVWRRTDLGNGQERLDRASRAFVTSPSASGGRVRFTLDMDALTDNPVPPDVASTRLFRAGTVRLDVNFVTTSRVQFDPNNNLTKPVDALGPGRVANYLTIPINLTQTISNSALAEPEPAANDVTFDPTGSANLNQLDIRDFTIGVVRS